MGNMIHVHFQEERHLNNIYIQVWVFPIMHVLLFLILLRFLRCRCAYHKILELEDA